MTLAEAEQAVIRAAIEWREHDTDMAKTDAPCDCLDTLADAVDALLALRLAAASECSHRWDSDQVCMYCNEWREPVPEQAKAEESDNG